MQELIVTGISIAMTLGLAWAGFHFIRAHLDMCDDVAAIKDKICDKEE